MFSIAIESLWTVFSSILSFVALLLGFILSIFLVFALYILIRCFPLVPEHLELVVLKGKFSNMFRWLLYDMLTFKQRKQVFSEYGFTVFCGRQGSGKTISMVDYLGRMRRRYPNVMIITNFDCLYSNAQMLNWRALLELRNGTDGIIFAIDEIHSEYSSAAWRDFPEAILSEISQQRKQRIKIVATSQVFSRIAKPIREQTMSVVMCQTYLHRWTRCKEYDAAEYSTTQDSSYSLKQRCKPINVYSYVQSNALRSAYDTYAKVERLSKVEFLSRTEKH